MNGEMMVQVRITLFEQKENRSENIRECLERNSIEVDVIRAYTGESLPNQKDIAALVLSGGPQSITEIDDLPYLKQQVELIRDAVKKNKPVLGICLGHQLLAYSIGGRIRKAEKPEMGWYNIHLNEEGMGSLLFQGIAQNFSMFQYHLDEVFDLDKEFRVLAFSSRTAIQAYQVSGKLAWGVQFHPEINAKKADSILFDRREVLKFHGINYEQMIARGYASASKVSERLFRNFCSLVKQNK